MLEVEDRVHGLEPWVFDDTWGPHVSSARADAAAAATITLRPSEPLSATPAAAHFTVLNLGNGQTVASSLIDVTYDAVANTVALGFTRVPGGRLADGAYRLTVAGAALRDLAGNAMTGNYAFDFILVNAGGNLTLPPAVTRANHLAIGAGGQLNLGTGPLLIDYRPGDDATSTATAASGLNIGTGGRLDLTDNRLILRSTASNRLKDAAGISAKIKSALNLGGTLWAGDGITTSLGGDGGSDFHALGIAINDLALAGGGVGPIYTNFAGEAVGVNDILVRCTVFGDADLDGAVGTNDYFQIDNGFLGSKTGWINGDFDYDGAVTTNDYFVIDNAFLAQQAAAVPTSSPVQTVAPVQPALSTAVPPRASRDRDEFAGDRTSLAASLLP